MKKRIQRGFTLVELLVVILIITILMAMILPSLERAQDAAYMAACGNNLKQVMLTTHEYGQDFRINLGQYVTIDTPATGNPINMMGYHLMYEGGYLESSDLIRINADINKLANRTRHNGSGTIMMCPASRFRGYAGTGSVFGSAVSTGGLDEIVYIGNKNRWRDLWMLTNCHWRWQTPFGRSEFTINLLGNYDALAVTSYAIQRTTRHAWKIGGSGYLYKPLRKIQNPSRKVWWAECVEPSRASAETFAYTGRAMVLGIVKNNYYPQFRLPHPYGEAGLFAFYDGHVGPFLGDDMVRAYLEDGCNFNSEKVIQQNWDFEFYAPEEEIIGADLGGGMPWTTGTLWDAHTD